MAEDAAQVETLVEAERAADEARRTGAEELIPDAVRAAYNAGNGADEIARVTRLPLDDVLTMLELDSGS
jgi:hypothetical protein